MNRLVALALMALALLAPIVPASAKVSQVNERGFVVRLVAQVPVDREKAWDELVNPADWWSSEHSFSGDAANFTLEPKPGGCFCEALPGGGVQHMVVVFVDKARALRLRGALGPMQADALDGTLTIQLKPSEGGEDKSKGEDKGGADKGKGAGTQIVWEYVIGGFSRAPFEAMAPAVDKVLAEQLATLVGKLGGKLEAEPSAAKADETPADKPAETAGPPKAEIIGR